MDEADFSEDATYKEQEDLPYDGDLSQTKACTSYSFTWTKDPLSVSEEVVLAGGDLQDTAALHEMCHLTALDAAWDKMPGCVVSDRRDKDKLRTLASPASASEGTTSNSHILDILLHYLSREQFPRHQGGDCKTLPETLNTDSLDDVAIFTTIISHYAKNYCLPEFTDQFGPQSGAENSNRPRCPAGTPGKNTCPLEKPVTARQSNHQEDVSFLSRTKHPGDKHKNCLGQTSQRQMTEKANSGNQFKHGQGQVHDPLPDFSKVIPKVKIARNTVTNKPFTIANQASFSPRLRNKLTVVQDSLGITSGSNCVEKQPEQKRKCTEPSQQTQSLAAMSDVNENTSNRAVMRLTMALTLMELKSRRHMESAIDTLQGLLTVESEKYCWTVTSPSQKYPSSNSYIYQKISQGKHMCQKLKEQTDQLKTKVQEFSKRIKQDSLCHLQDIRLMTEEHACCLPGPWGSQGMEVTSLPRAGPQEATSKEFSDLVSMMKQKIEKRDHRRTNCGKLSSTIHGKTPYQDSSLSSDPGPSFSSDFAPGLQSNRCEDCGNKTHNSQRVCDENPPKEFYYRYDTPGQNDLNHSGGYIFAQSHFSRENKMSSSCEYIFCMTLSVPITAFPRPSLDACLGLLHLTVT
ncbi:protein AKNAD1 [Psammomys obesus]|uniref:protein AKNAD1 n=1 Tax=Psammomys obesus TaxID=48139 RepID=UPI0024529B5D|nr:protein AKNAD1 [Psammomys obesus]